MKQYLFATLTWIGCLAPFVIYAHSDTAEQQPTNNSFCFQLSFVPFKAEIDPGLFNDVYQQPNGYIWLSGTSGINAFDGRMLTSYANGNPKAPLGTGPSPANVGDISGSQEGLLYFHEVSTNRVACFDPAKRQLAPMPAITVPPGHVLKGYVRGRKETGLALLVNQEQQTFQLRTVPGNKEIYKGPYRSDMGYFFRFEANQYWFFNGRTALRIDPGDYQAHPFHFPSNSNGIRDLSANGDTLYLLDDWGLDLYACLPNQDSLVLYHHLHQRAHRVAIDAGVIYAGYAWACWVEDHATGQISSYISAFGKLIEENEQNGRGFDLIKIFVANDHSVFLVRQRALYRLQRCLPATASFVEKVHYGARRTPAPFRAITEDEAGTIYASYYIGVVQKKPGKDETFYPVKGMHGLDTVMKAAFSLNWWNGQLLWNNGLLDPRTGQLTLLGPPTRSHTNQYLQNDTLWFYNWRSNHLNCYDLRKKVLTAIPLDRQVAGPDGFIEEMNMMIPDASGKNFWLATKWEGIILIDRKGKLLKKYGAKELGTSGAFSTTVNTLGLYRDSLWFGCPEGLGVLDPATSQVILYKDPVEGTNGYLQNLVVFSFTEDYAHNLCLGTDRGLVYFNRDEKQFYHLPEGHPLTQIECNRPSIYRARNGRYYLGTTAGLYSFTPSMLNFSPVSLAVEPPLIERIDVFNSLTGQPRYIGTGGLHQGTVELDAFEKNIELRLSVPSFDQPLFYRYELVGAEYRKGDYTLASTISLQNLKPGQYTLIVKAATTINDQQASITRLHFYIPTVWYKRTWIILLITLLVLAAVIWLTYNRFDQQLKRARRLALLRTQISQDLHDDVGSILTSISLQSQFMALSSRTGDPQSLQEISQMSKEAMEKMRDIVWSIDSRKDSYTNLVDRMQSFAEQVFEHKGISCHFTLDCIHGADFIGPAQRKNIYLIFKEAITNIAKHSDATTVQVKLSRSRQSLDLLVQDNGSPTSIRQGGLGMNNMHSRAKAIQASLRTGYKEGFFVELIAPAGKK